MADLVLREATEADVPTIVALVHAAFAEYRGRIDPPSGAHNESIEHVRQKMAAARVVLADKQTVPAGCVFYEHRMNHVYLFRLAVLPDHRQQGIAHRLIEHVEARARSLNVPYVRLGVRLALPHIRNYYERLGYHALEYGKHVGYSEPTYVILEKNLAPGDTVMGV